MNVTTSRAARTVFRGALALVLATAGIVSSLHAGLVLSGGGLTLVEQGGTFAPDNLAAASGGAIPLGSSSLGPQIGVPFHVIANVNDGLYGNGNSWIGGDA